MVCKRQEQCVFGEKCIHHIGSVLPKCSMFEQKPPIKQTEQEYIQTCTTEQLAEVLGKIAKNAYQCGQNGKTNKCVNRHNCTGYCDYGWELWLKQPHSKVAK